MEDSKRKAEALNQQFISFSQMKIIVSNQPELQPMQSVSITTIVISSNPAKASSTRYNIM